MHYATEYLQLIATCLNGPLQGCKLLQKYVIVLLPVQVLSGS